MGHEVVGVREAVGARGLSIGPHYAPLAAATAANLDAFRGLASGEVQCLSPAAAEVLERCDGSRTVQEVVEIFPEPVRADAERCVREIARAGLLV